MKKIVLLLILSICCALSVADNYTVRTATGADATIAADDIGQVLYPRTKLVTGEEGTDVSATTPLPVTEVQTQAVTYTIPVPVSMAKLNVSNATKTAPIVITCSADVSDTFGSDTGYVKVTGVTGTTTANGYFEYTASGASMTLMDSFGNGNFSGGGVIQRINTITPPADIDVSGIYSYLTYDNTESLYSAYATPVLEVMAFNPDVLGERTTVFEYVNPATLMRYNQAAKETHTYDDLTTCLVFNVPLNAMVPQSWLLGVLADTSNLDTSYTTSYLYARATTASELGWRYFDLTKLNTHLYIAEPSVVQACSTSVLTNGDCQDWTGSTLDDFTVLPASGIIAKAGSVSDYYAKIRVNEDLGLEGACAIIFQAASVTEGHTYNYGFSYTGSIAAAAIINVAGMQEVASSYGSIPVGWQQCGVQYTAAADATMLFTAIALLPDTVYGFDDFYMCDLSATNEGEGEDCEDDTYSASTTLDGYATKPNASLHPARGTCTVAKTATSGLTFTIDHNMSNVTGIYLGEAAAGANDTSPLTLPGPYTSYPYVYTIPEDELVATLGAKYEATTLYIVMTSTGYALPQGGIRGNLTIACDGLDHEAPTAVCTDVTVELDAGVAAIDASELGADSTDNFAITAYEADTLEVTADDMPTVDVEVTVSDAAGFTDTCTATVTITDEE